ncbi:ankyrin repeat domain-containing protein [Bordetella sp. 15P40C-2]|uniref:ankyrin repeat domain-containing protein n=1 Tax=Bordetella sp. 15P40C-2 TaxID=2572246 RepID=UPI0013277FA7|nr:hypothetical protein [Bordetella sp. 15P40C-2]
MTINSNTFSHLWPAGHATALPLDAVTPLDDSEEWDYMESLRRAIEEGDEGTLSTLLQQRPDFDLSEPLNEGHPALFQAAMKGNVAVVEVLLRHCDASPAVLASPGNDFDVMSPLAIAYLLQHREVVALLCEAGAEVNHPDDQIGGTLLCLAAARDDVVMLNVLRAAGADLELMGVNGKTPLLAAVSGGNVRAVKVLLEMGAKIDGPYPEGRALFTAIERADAHMVELVLDLGTPVNVRNPETGLTPLLTAIRAQKTDVVHLLLQRGADVTARDYRGYSVLLSAMEAKAPELVTLFAAHPDVDIARRSHHALSNARAPESAPYFQSDTQCLVNNAGRGRFFYSETALMVAARLGNLPAIKAFLDVKRTPDPDRNRNLLHDPMRLLDEQNDQRSTALMLAVQHGHVDIVAELSARGANANLCSIDGKFPLLVAIERGDDAMIEVLLASGVDVNASSRPDRTTALMRAVERGRVDLLSVLCSKGAQLDARDADAGTALTRAVYLGNLDAVKKLLELGAQPGPGPRARQVPLILAAMKGRADIVAALIEARADVNARSLRHTALMVAAGYNHHEVVRILIAAGADIMATNGNWTAKQIAAKRGAWAAYRLLLEAGDLTGARKRRL